jgi:hypothetical protein
MRGLDPRIFFSWQQKETPRSSRGVGECYGAKARLAYAGTACGPKSFTFAASRAVAQMKFQV